MGYLIGYTSQAFDPDDPTRFQPSGGDFGREDPGGRPDKDPMPPPGAAPAPSIPGRSLVSGPDGRSHGGPDRTVFTGQDSIDEYVRRYGEIPDEMADALAGRGLDLTGGEGLSADAKRAEALNRERWEEAKGYMDPYAADARTARDQMMIEMGLAPGEAGTAYMETGGYQGMLSESQRSVEQASATGGNLYSGARMKAAGEVGAGVQNQFYNNYMTMLQNIGNPDVATNLAGLGMNQGAYMGGGRQAPPQQQGSMWGDVGALAGMAYGGPLWSAGGRMAGTALEGWLS